MLMVGVNLFVKKYVDAMFPLFWNCLLALALEEA